jgi:putative nucleotidyltransferase with HDIG domain
MTDSFIALTGLSPKVEGLEWESATLLRIGRQSNVEVMIQDVSIEKLHAEIKFQGQRWMARPLTTNEFFPTLLNGQPVPIRGTQVRLGDTFSVGKIKFLVSAIGNERMDRRATEELATRCDLPPTSERAPRPIGDDLLTPRVSSTTMSGPTPNDGKASPNRPTPSPNEPPAVSLPPTPVVPMTTVPTASVAPVAPVTSVAPSPVAGPLGESTRPGQLVMTGMIARPKLGNSGAGPASPAPLPPAPSVNSATPSMADMQVLRVEATAQRTWDQALDLATQSLTSRPDASRTMMTLLRTNHHLSNVSQLDDLLQNILVDALGALDAQRGTIILFNPKTDQLEMKARCAPHPAVANKKGYSRTLAERCYRQGESLLCRDLHSEDVSAVRSAMFGSMSSIVCALLRTPRQRLGVLHLDRGPFQEPFSESDLYLADAIAANVAVGIECAQLVESQAEQFLQTVTTLARAVDMRDQETGDHTKRVTDFALLLAEDLSTTPADKYAIRIGAPLHDIGKIGVDDAVLRKPGKLTDGEFEHMKTHTVKGAKMIDGFGSLAPLLPIVRNHHERWDGSGYPDKIGQNKIALTARIVAVADAFDAMTSHRPYRPAMPPQLAFLELLTKSGSHFDPQVVQSFLRLRPKVEEMMQTHRNQA